MTERKLGTQSTTTWVIEVSAAGAVKPVEELVGGELLKRFSGSFPKKPGVYQWRPIGYGFYDCDPATGGVIPTRWGWGEGIVPKEEWLKSKLYPAGGGM